MRAVRSGTDKGAGRLRRSDSLIRTDTVSSAVSSGHIRSGGIKESSRKQEAIQQQEEGQKISIMQPHRSSQSSTPERPAHRRFLYWQEVWGLCWEAFL